MKNDLWNAIEQWINSQDTFIKFSYSIDISFDEYRDSCSWIIAQLSMYDSNYYEDNVVSLRKNKVCLVIDGRRQDNFGVILEQFDENNLSYTQICVQPFTKEGVMVYDN